jgi:hypothetical protein
MIVVVAATKVKTPKVMFLVFCSDFNNSSGKVNKREPVYGKLVGTGLVMDNYAGCGSSCNSHNIG